MQASFNDPPDHGGPISWELARDATMLFYVRHREVSLTHMENLLTFWRRANNQQIGAWPVAQQLDQLLLALNVRPAGRRRGRGGG